MEIYKFLTSRYRTNHKKKKPGRVIPVMQNVLGISIKWYKQKHRVSNTG